MNKLLRLACILGLLVVLSVDSLGGVKSASSNGGINPAVHVLWKAKIVNDDVTATGISVGIGGSKQYPLISYDLDATNGVIRFARPAVVYAGNCGVGNTWECNNIPQYAAPGFTSRMQVFKYQNSFKVGWAYQSILTNQDIHLISLELTDDLVSLGASDQKIIDRDFFIDDGLDWRQTRPASFVFDEVGNPHLAVVYGFGLGARVVYAYKQRGGLPTTPCNHEVNSLYQCDIIYESDHPIFSDVRIGLTAAGSPRIGFFSYVNESLMLAYPQSSALFHPNCGPGGNSWRCIVIDTSTAENSFYAIGKPPTLDMAIGPASPHIIIKSLESGIEANIRYAKYVGAGGNCGLDYGFTSISPPTVGLLYKWQCSTIPWDRKNSPPYLNFSLKVDSLDYPVIALNMDTGAYYHVGVLYPAERAGGVPGNWKFTKVDGRDIDTGYAVALALTEDDRGLIAYGELESYGSNLKIAYQNGFKTYIPSAIK